MTGQVLRCLLYNCAKKSVTSQSQTPLMPQTALQYEVEVQEISHDAAEF